ncbi:Hypothetical protein IALB_2617 [Ignavibacterium album JCM 16511]|uniref:DUF4905 domain-containing protein n=1 Tax=Ignavibacterium album (strain DSM 19864 / JCM 16511 / NBRC 101810 / Mat9-16) TaxID=945713 RepID=I0AMW3_IGNAJ|nr:DUF4905 domain-containing protein [Ignavibacterium album]AFH50320.1 Hypothetical protein IALB_2617 [Ignavibacterium album JCM 16511]
MVVKNLYKYDRGRQIFRLIPTDTGKLIIEERERNIKEAFFSCLDILTGRSIFSDLQFDEKYWIGIESIYKDVILFHRFERPDLPNHKGIIAYDIKSQTVLWENPNSFLYAGDDKIVFLTFDSGIKGLIAIDYLSGEVFNDEKIILEIIPEKEDFSSYIHSKRISLTEVDKVAGETSGKIFSDYLINGDINFASRDNFSFYSFHHITENGKLDNLFFAVDESGTIILKETLNKGLDKLEPESFFIKDDLLFLLFGSTGVGVYQII